MSIAASFDEHWKLDLVTGCWVWQRACKGKEVASGGGYGCFRLKGKLVAAHVFSYERAHGSVPPGLHVMHSCDNTKCVNPVHLLIGTNLQNAQDKHKKGRYPSRLSMDDVVQIKTYRAAGWLQREIAVKYKLHQGDVSHILAGHYWKHVDAPTI